MVSIMGSSPSSSLNKSFALVQSQSDCSGSDGKVCKWLIDTKEHAENAV